MTTVQEAEAALETMQAKQVAALDRATNLAVERRRIAFAAHSGDAAARARLDEINRATAELDGEIDGLAAAVEEARRLRGEAQHQADAGAEADRVTSVRALAPALRECGQRMQAAAAALVAAHQDAEVVIGQLHALGCKFPTAVQVQLFGVKGLSTALFNTRLQIEHLAPGERHTFEGTFGQWAARVAQYGATEQKAA